MFSSSASIALAILSFSASALSSPVLTSDSSPCGSAVTSYVTVTPLVTSIVDSGTFISSTSTTSGNSSPSSVRSPDCQENNCLRQFMKAPEIPAFCRSYTTTINTATTGLPSYVSMCDANPSEISSACSCLPTTTSSSIPTPTSLDCQQNNCLRQFMNPTNTQVTPFCNAYTATVDNAMALPTFVDMCDGDPKQVSSACSCIAPPSVSTGLSTSTMMSPPLSDSTSLPTSSITTTTESLFVSSTQTPTLSGITSISSGISVNPSSTISTPSSGICPSASAIYQTTTTIIFVTLTASQLPASVSSMFSVTTV